MGPLLPNVKQQFFSDDGDPLTGGFLYVYFAGTSTPATTYSNYLKTVANANPIVLDSRGEADVWLVDGSYKFVLATALDVTIWTVDNIKIEDATAISTLHAKYTNAHGVFQTAGLTQSVTGFALPAKTVLESIIIKHSEAFAGTSITEYYISVGVTGDLTRYVDSFDVFQAIGDTVFEVDLIEDIQSFINSTDIVITATAVGANLDQSTAGSVDIWAKTKGML